MNTVSTGTRKLRLATFTLPILLVGVFQLGGCMRGTPSPPPPGGTYLSTDGGVTFEQQVMRSDAEEGQHIARMNLTEAYRPLHAPTNIYIPAREQGIVISKDNGKTWEIAATPLVTTTNVVVMQDNTWVVSGVGEDEQGYIIRSLDEGEEWEIVQTIPLAEDGRSFTFIQGSTAQSSVVLSLAQDPFNADGIYAGSTLGTVFLGQRSAQAWSTIHSLKKDTFTGVGAHQTTAISKIIPSPNEPNDYLLLTRNRQLVRVTNGQQQTIRIPQNFGENNPLLGTGGSLRVYDAEFVPGFPDAILVGVNNGLVLTRDRGETWVKLTVPIDEVLDFSRITVTTSPVNPNRFFVTFNNVLYRSEDAGQTWITYSFGAVGVPGVITDVSIDPTDENNIVVVTAPARI